MVRFYNLVIIFFSLMWWLHVFFTNTSFHIVHWKLVFKWGCLSKQDVLVLIDRKEIFMSAMQMVPRLMAWEGGDVGAVRSRTDISKSSFVVCSKHKEHIRSIRIQNFSLEDPWPPPSLCNVSFPSNRNYFQYPVDLDNTRIKIIVILNSTRTNLGK